MAAMAHNRGGKIGQNVEALESTAFGDRQQTSRGQLALSATVVEADFAPLHAGAQRSFSAVVGGLNALLIEESEQPLIVLKQSRGEVADLTVGTVQMPLGQRKNP